MLTHLTSTDQWDFVPVTCPEDCAPIAEHLGDQAVFEVALCLGFVPTLEQFSQFLADGTVRIWQCRRPGSKTAVAYAIDVYRFEDHEMFVWCQGGWDNDVVADILPLLSSAVLEGDPKAVRVWMVIPLPLPEGSQALILSLGFDPVGDDMAKDLKQTYGLERKTWRIYTGQDEA